MINLNQSAFHWPILICRTQWDQHNLHFSSFQSVCWCILFFSEFLSVGIQGNRCGGIKASARGWWSRQSSWCSSSRGFISHCEWFKTKDSRSQPNLLSDMFLQVTDEGVSSRLSRSRPCHHYPHICLMGAWPRDSTHPPHVVIIHTFDSYSCNMIQFHFNMVRVKLVKCLLKE